MALKLLWDDVPEEYDDRKALEKIRLFPEPFSVLSSGCSLVKGDNYPVLLLLRESLKNSVDFIYIDPPYNTGNQFVYKDDFAAPKDRHSAWLSFMKRRLILAREMLKETGCIFIAIGQEELFVLKLLCDSIFGEENYVNDFMWLHGKGKKDTWSRTMEQHTLCYARNKKVLKPFSQIKLTSWAKNNADKDPRGPWFSGSISFSEKRSAKNHKNYYAVTSPSGIKWERQWQVSKTEMEQLLQENKIYFGNAPEYNKVPRKKIFNDEETEIIPPDLIEDMASTRQAQNYVNGLLGCEDVFDNPKPVELIQHFLKISAQKNDALVLDFFAGSGTTYEAVQRLNSEDGGTRRTILIQKPEPTWEYALKNDSAHSRRSGAPEVSAAGPVKIPRKGSEQAFNAGFTDIFQICQCRIKKASELYHSSEALRFYELKSL